MKKQNSQIGSKHLLKWCIANELGSLSNVEWAYVLLILVESRCPFSHNTAFDFGSKCCASPTRSNGPQCPSHPAEPTNELQFEDQIGCCANDDYQPCSPEGAVCASIQPGMFIWWSWCNKCKNKESL